MRFTQAELLAELKGRLARWSRQPVETVEIPEETREQLRALGYGV